MALLTDLVNLDLSGTTDKIIAEYIWIGGSGMDLRSKARTLPGPVSDPSKLPKWNYDGSSTGQAPGEDSEVILHPQAIFKDPFRRGNNILVMCDCYTPAGEPIPTNKRNAAAKVFSNPEVAVQMELTQLKAHTESSLNVILKFYEVRCREYECPSNISFEEKCSLLLNDSAENWSFSSDGETSTSKYIASLEEENESLKAKIVKMQSNLRMGFEIEQHLQRNTRALEKKQALNDDRMRNGLSALKKVHTDHKVEIMKILEEESLQLSTAVNEIQDKLTQIRINAENIGNPVGEMQCCDSSCKDVHVTMDVGPDTSPKDDVPAGHSATFDDSKWLAQALQEKMEALMLFSQEQERYMLENQRNQATIEDLQKSLSQVKDEKVKALMELAKLKEAYHLKCKSTAVDGHGTVDTPKIISGHDQQGMLKTIFNRTSLRNWVKKENSNIGHESSDGNHRTVCKECSVDLARVKVENATLLESIATMERLTSLVHRLHNVLTKLYDDVKSDISLESTYEALNSLITEANLMKTALGVVLPVSWSGDSSGAITSDAVHDSSDSPKSSKSEKADPLSSASMEMVELLILAADIVKESFMMKR